MMIRKGDTVKIKPQWQDSGDSNYHWTALSDEEGGRLDISPVDCGLVYPPVYTVTTDMLEPPTLREKRLILDGQVRHACEMNDLDDACLFIQDLLDVTDGGLASIAFSGFDWDNSSVQDRMEQMYTYIKSEAAHA